MIPDHLRIQPGQQALTPEQEAEAQRFADERIAAQLSTAPVDEQEAERLLLCVYAVAGLPPPTHIHWVDGPLQVAALAPRNVEANVVPSVESVWESIRERVGTRMLDRVRERVWDSVEDKVWDQVGASVWE